MSQPLLLKPPTRTGTRKAVHWLIPFDNNLFVTTADGKTQQVTDEPKGIVCGQSVHRQNLVSQRYFLKSKGNLLSTAWTKAW